VKALVQLQPQGKKLTSNSRKLIENAFFWYVCACYKRRSLHQILAN
jgi:hypothetical protein